MGRFKNEVGYVEQSRRLISHRSTGESGVDNEQNENIESTIIKRHGGHLEEHIALTHVIPNRIIQKTCEKQTQRIV